MSCAVKLFRQSFWPRTGKEGKPQHTKRERSRASFHYRPLAKITEEDELSNVEIDVSDRYPLMPNRKLNFDQMNRNGPVSSEKKGQGKDAGLKTSSLSRSRSTQREREFSHEWRLPSHTRRSQRNDPKGYCKFVAASTLVHRKFANIVDRNVTLQSDSYGRQSSRVDSRPTVAYAQDKPFPFGQVRGKLKLALYVNHGLLTVHIVQARHLTSKISSSCSTIVKVTLVPSEKECTKHKTEVVYDSGHPHYNDKFSFEILDNDRKRRLLLSVWNKAKVRFTKVKDTDSKHHLSASESCTYELLGCMSFGVKHLLHTNKVTSGWYYLLSDNIGPYKHLKVMARSQIMTSNGNFTQSALRNIPEVNKDLEGMDSLTIVMKKGRGGFGFTVMGSSPVIIGRVDQGSVASEAGLQKDDCVVRINGQNVSRSMADSVAKIVRQADRQLIMCVQRPNNTPKEIGSPTMSALAPIEEQDENIPPPGYVSPWQQYHGQSPWQPRCPMHNGKSSGNANQSAVNALPWKPNMHIVQAEVLPQKSPEMSSFGQRRSPCQQQTSPRTSPHASPSPQPPRCPGQLSPYHQSPSPCKQTPSPSKRCYSSASSSSSSPATPPKCRSPESAMDISPCQQGHVISGDESLHEVLSAEESCQENGVDVGRCRVTTRMTSAPPQLTLGYQELNCEQRDRQSNIQKLLAHEEEFIQQMQFAIQRYSSPLRHSIISPSDHATLFQNVEKVVAVSEYHVQQMQENSIGYSDSNDNDKERFIDNIGSVYLPKVSVMSEVYESYCGGLKSSFRLLYELRQYSDFDQFLQSPTVEHGQLSISGFIQKPLEHFKDIVVTLQRILALTSLEHQDYDNLAKIVETMRNACNRINENNTRRSRSMTSLVSRSSAHSRTSGQSKTSGHSKSSVHSQATSIASVDTEVMDIQGRLIFAPNVQPFQLATATRHMIYSGELVLFDGHRSVRLCAVILSDLLLLTRIEADDTLLVLDYPILCHDITAMDFSCQHPTEFQLTIDGTSSPDRVYDRRRLVLRAPTLDLKCTWKNVLEQRIAACKKEQELVASGRVADNIV